MLSGKLGKAEGQLVDDLSTAQIGASGVLLIQYRLLKFGIESAPMTTDSGIDLVVYAPKSNKAVTVQVKSCLKPKPAGGNGRMSLDWYLRRNSPAELVGLVNLERDQVWLFRHEEFASKAQQETTIKWHFCMSVEDDYFPSPERKTRHEREFESFYLGNRISDLFGSPHSN